LQRHHAPEMLTPANASAGPSVWCFGRKQH
jgi:hypothetical protein